jgi:hypothetical protein
MSRATQLTVGQGESFTLAITILDEANNPVDLTNVSFTGSIKETYSSEDVSANFSFQVVAPATSGSVTITLPATTTSTLTAQDYVYDVVRTDGTDVRRLLEGKLIVRPGVTLTS